jgi:predicted small metal-binding protein
VLAIADRRYSTTVDRQVKCECGYVARGDTDDQVVARIRDHMRTDHPDLRDKVSDDQIRGWIETVA